MGVRSLIGLSLVALTFLFVGCDSDTAQKIQPETRGKRGERCQARNDCDAGLACLNNVCAKNEFDIAVSAKHCDRVECKDDTDCCGDKLTMAPTRCKRREEVCVSQIPGCTPGGICTSSVTCGNGTCPLGTCTSGVGACETAAQCLDRCVDGTCRVSGAVCTVETEATDCTLYSNSYSCSTRSCSCANPAYDPSDPICSDEACTDICVLRCDNDLCVRNDSCETDQDCTSATPLCDGGRCVQCLTVADCDAEAEETCVGGSCQKPCTQNEECDFFEACDDGDCVYVGCKDDKECILAAARGQDGIGGTSGTGVSSGADDPRLFKCLASELDRAIKTCKIPCENDGSCGKFQDCADGYCKFIGCENDEQCRAYLGIANQETSEDKPYVATAVCRD